MARTATPYVFNAAANSAGTRAYFKALSDSLTGAGMVRTADTGQVNWTTSTDGSGYEVLAFSDALQSTAPMYVRPRYLSGGQAAPTNGGVYLSVGTATDGAGNLVGTVTPEVRLTNWSGVAVAAVGGGYGRTAYGSHGEGYLTWVFDVDPTLTTGTDCPGVAVVERFRNADGTSSPDGFNLWHMMRVSDTSTTWQGGYSRTKNDPAPQPGLDWEPRLVVPNLVNANSYFVGTTVQAFPALTAGVGVRGSSKAFCAGLPVDFPRNSEIPMTLYGQQMSFRSYSGLLNVPLSVRTASATWGVTKNLCPILRWE